MIRKILCFIFLFFSLHSLSAEESMIQRLSQKKDQNLNPPAVSIHTLKNGMKVYWLEDDELPIFEMQVFIKGGTRLDPPALSGAASMMGALLRTGGTQKFSTVEIDRLLDNKGAEIETGMGFEYATAKLACLSEDQNELVPLLFEMLAEPRFAEGQIDLVRAQKIEALARLRDDPEKLASKKFPELVFGEGSIYSKTPSEQSLKKVQKNDLIQIHQMMFHPSQMIVAVSGKFKKDALFSLLEKSTQKMSQVKTPLPDLPAVEKKIENGFFGMDKKGVQSTLLIGHFGDQRFNPDKFAIILMNYLLGGDIFSSRLGQEVRSDRGLAYSVFSHFGLESQMGLFYVFAQTQSSRVAESIQVIQNELRDFHEGKHLNEENLRFAKNAILQQMVGDWDPKFNYVKERARLGFYGYPENYLDVFKKSLEAVTLDQVKQAAKKYLYPDRLKVLVVGDLKSLGGKGLGSLKEVNVE